jgi:hypothetical protein
MQVIKTHYNTKKTQDPMQQTKLETQNASKNKKNPSKKTQISKHKKPKTNAKT